MTVLSIEPLELNVYLCRWHKEGSFGSPYIANCVVHIVDGMHYIHGLLVKEGKISRKEIDEIKRRFNTKNLFFERVKNDKFVIRKI